MISSGSRAPESMYCWAWRPKSVPSAMAVRSMSPVEMWGAP